MLEWRLSTLLREALFRPLSDAISEHSLKSLCSGKGKEPRKGQDCKPRKNISYAFVSCKLIPALFTCRPCWFCCVLKEMNVGLEPKWPLGERPCNLLFSWLATFRQTERKTNRQTHVYTASFSNTTPVLQHLNQLSSTTRQTNRSQEQGC